ncbi:MAG: sodium:calcium antiporter, partial [Candidatus Margulisiibacteriota bacterium]
MVWIKFLICAVAILWAGRKLTQYGDILAEKTGMGHAWIGIVLLAMITSLPETANGISAVTAVNSPDLAVGNVFGACLYNMFYIAVLDIIQFFRKKPTIFQSLGQGNKTTGVYVFLMVLTALVGTVLSKNGMDLVFFNVSIYTFLLFIIYAVAMRALYHGEKGSHNGELVFQHLSMFQVVFWFCFYSLVVVAAGAWLPFIGEEIS